MKSKKNILALGALIGFALLCSAFIRRNKDIYDSDSTYIYRNYDSPVAFAKVDYPKSRYDFCGERMPVNDPENYKKFNLELKSFLAYPNGLKQLFRRADKNLPLIEKRLEMCNLPADLKYIPMIESRFIFESSSKGAGGYWQFMPATAMSYGLEVSDSVDERNDIVKSTRAACSYFHNLHKQTKTWTLAAAAYNVGEGKVDYKMHHASNLFPTYYNVEWNKETSVYVFRLLAIKYLYEHREQYGL